MRIFFKLVWEIIWKPTWGVFLLLLGFGGHIQTVIGFIESVLGKDPSDLGDNLMIVYISSFISNYWGLILMVVGLVAITNGIFQKSRNYLGDRVVANKITLIPREDEHKSSGEEKYSWIQIDNDEEFDLRECYAAIKVLKIKSGDMWLPWEEVANENISHLTFPEFQDKEVIVHPNIPVRLNIAKTPNGSSIEFIFRRGDKKVPHSGEDIYIEIVFGGIDYGRNGERRKIEDKVFKGFLILENGYDPPYETQIATTDTKVVQDGNKKTTTIVREEVTKMEGPLYWHRLYLKPGELSDNQEENQEERQEKRTSHT